MIYYGDASRRLDLAAWRDRCRRLTAHRPDEVPLARHARLVALLIETGQVAQALADRAFEAAGGRDQDDPHAKAALDLTGELARRVWRSWESGFTQPPAPLQASPAWHAEDLVAREPEGFAFYALYPEAHAAAARRLEAKDGRIDTHVIGLRSIGVTLAAMVAAAQGDVALDTVRPHGHPYRRRIDAPDLLRRLAVARPGRICIVDEGPGRSGSSMAAAVAALAEHGLADADLHLFPGHMHAPGPEASEQTRHMFATVPRHVVDFDDLVLASDAPGGGLANWVSDLTGPATQPLADLSAGRWRAWRYDAQADWPACDIRQERRKYLLVSASGRYLLKFIGLGRRSAEWASVAGRISDAGFSPGLLGVRHGFSVERWRDDLRPVPAGRRDALLRFMAGYLAFRRSRLSEPDLAGADAPALRAMALHNTCEALGSQAAEALAAQLRDFDRAFAQGRRCRIDGRMQAQEWMSDGHDVFCKADAVDHHAGHDLIGAQDIAWDVAGAAAGLSLSDAEIEALCDALERASGVPVLRALVDAFRPIYLAFDIGRLTLAEGSVGGGEERRRLSRERDRLALALRARLDAGV